jgi:uncharacterized protein
MMFSVDYPFSANTRGRKFLEEAAGMMSAEDMERLVGGNAERVLGLAG